MTDEHGAAFWESLEKLLRLLGGIRYWATDACGDAPADVRLSHIRGLVEESGAPVEVGAHANH